MQFPGARGRQLNHEHSGQRPHRRKRRRFAVVCTTTRGLHTGQSRRQRMCGRGSFCGCRTCQPLRAASCKASRSSGSDRCQRQTAAAWILAIAAAMRRSIPADRSRMRTLTSWLVSSRLLHTQTCNQGDSIFGPRPCLRPAQAASLLTPAGGAVVAGEGARPIVC